jgi:hypothetical protein
MPPAAYFTFVGYAFACPKERRLVDLPDDDAGKCLQV